MTVNTVLTVFFPTVNKHYGLNRYNRRTVREDIPIAKVVQTDEEVRQQNERFQELQALKAQLVYTVAVMLLSSIYQC